MSALPATDAEAAAWAEVVGLTDPVHAVTLGSVNLHLRRRLAGQDVFVKVYPWTSSGTSARLRTP